MIDINQLDDVTNEANSSVKSNVKEQFKSYSEAEKVY